MISLKSKSAHLLSTRGRKITQAKHHDGTFIRCYKKQKMKAYMNKNNEGNNNIVSIVKSGRTITPVRHHDGTIIRSYANKKVHMDRNHNGKTINNFVSDMKYKNTVPSVGTVNITKIKDYPARQSPVFHQGMNNRSKLMVGKGPYSRVMREFKVFADNIVDSFGKMSSSQKRRRRKSLKKIRQRKTRQYNLKEPVRIRKQCKHKPWSNRPDKTYLDYFVRGDDTSVGLLPSIKTMVENDHKVNVFDLKNFFSLNEFETRDADDNNRLICQYHKGVIDWNELRNTGVVEGIQYKLTKGRNVVRGKSNSGGVSMKYVIEGHRKDPLGKDIAPYAYKDDADPADADYRATVGFVTQY